MNNGNLDVHDRAYDCICAQSDVNLNTKTPVFVYEKHDQQHVLMGHELTNNSDCQETLNDEDGCSKKDRISKTSTSVSSPSLIVSPCCSVKNIWYIFAPSWEQGAKIHDTVHAEIIHSGINCNPVISSVPDNTAAVLKNPVDVSERKLSLTGIQTDPHVCDKFQLDVRTLEKELVFVLQTSEISIRRNSFLLNTADVGRSSSDVFPDYVRHTLMKTDTNISAGSKFLENCSSAINVQYVSDSGSCDTHILPDISNTSEVSASENCCVRSEAHGMLAIRLDVVNDHHTNFIQDRICKIMRESDFSVSQQRKSLQTVNTLWSALPIIFHIPLYMSYISCFNTSYSWQEADKNKKLETYSALCKSSHIQTAIIKHSNSNSIQKLSIQLGDCISYNESSRHINSLEIMEIFDGRKVICEDVPLQSSTVLQKGSVRADQVSAYSEQHSLHSDRNKPANVIMQMKLMAADSAYDLRDCTRDSSVATVNGFTAHAIMKCQKVRSLSQPSLPTYLLHDSTDDEQFSENSDGESDCLSETFREYENIYQENISEFLAANGKSKHMEMPCNAINVAAHETADCNQNVYTLQSYDMYDTAVTEFKADKSLTELYNKPQKLHMKGDKLRFCEESQLSCPLSLEIDTGTNDHVVPFGTIQDTNILEGEDRNILQMESEISQNIIVIENGVNERAYPNNDKQQLFISVSHSQMLRGGKVILGRNVQCNVYNLPDIADSWNSLCTKTCSEEAETAMLSECRSNFARGANMQCKVCTGTWVSDTNECKIRKEITTTQTHEPREKMCDFTVSHSRTGNRCDPGTVRDNICSQEYITVKEPRIFTRPVSANMCSNANYISYQNLPDQNHIVLPNSDPEPVSNSCKNSCDQKQPVSCPCVENGHSHTQMPEVHNKSPGNTVNSCIDIAIKKYDTDIPRKLCYAEVKPTEDVAVQTNIRSLISLRNQNGCFVCFSNNHFNSNGFKTGTHHNLASKRNFEALDLESVSLKKKPRYDTLKSIYLESDISELPVNLKSKSENSETIEGSFPDNANEESDFQSVGHLDGLQDTSIMDIQNSVDSDQKVPDVGKDIYWMEDVINEKELYERDQIMKGKVIILLINIPINLPFSLPQ
jgi:hypothetical protein